MRKVLRITNKKTLAVLISSALMLTACGGGGDDDSNGNNGGDGSDGSRTKTSVKILTQDAARFVFIEDPSATQKKPSHEAGYSKSMTFSTVAATESTDTEVTRAPLQCELFMREVGAGVNAMAKLAPVFKVSNLHPDDEMECEVIDAVATTTDLYLRGKFLNFRVANADGGYDEIVGDEDVIEPTEFSNCSILRVPMYGESGDIECIADAYATKGAEYNYSYSSLEIDDTLDNVYYGRAGGMDTGTDSSVFKYNKNDGAIEILTVDRPEIERPSAPWKIFVTSGDYVIVDYLGALARVDMKTKVQTQLSRGHTGVSQTRLLNGLIVSTLLKGNSGSLVIDMETGQDSYLNEMVETPYMVAGAEKTWASIIYNGGTVMCLSEYSKDEPIYKKTGGSCISLTGTALSEPSIATFLESKVGDTNYAYVFNRDEDADIGGDSWAVIDKISYIDLNTDQYHDTNILSHFSTTFKQIVSVKTYAGGIIVSGFNLANQRVDAYLDQQNMIEYFPNADDEVVNIHSTVEILQP